MKHANHGPSRAGSDHAGLREEALLELGTQLSVLLSSARAFTAETAANFKPPLSGASFQVLQRLHSVGATRSMRIAEALAMDRSALSRLLQQLTQARLVETYPDPLDGRVTMYGLTNDARKRMDRAMADKGSRFSERLQGWSNAEIRQLSGLLGRFNGSSFE